MGVLGAQDAGGVDEYVEPAEGADRGGHTLLDGVLVGYVEERGGEPVFVTLCGRPVGGGLQAGLVDVHGVDPAALGEDAVDGGLADAGATAGDEDATSFVTVHGASVPKQWHVLP